MTRGASLPVRLMPALPLVFVFPAGAEAHTAMEGSNHFTSGILHPLLTPAHLLVLIALGILLGQHSPLRMRVILRVFAPLAGIALGLTASGRIPGAHPAVLAAVALGAGAMVAFGKEPPPVLRWAIFAAGAVAIGLDSGVETGTRTAAVTTLLGTWTGLLLFLFAIAYYASLAAAQPRKWLHIALRVAGSWIAAISLLMLAFALRK